MADDEFVGSPLRQVPLLPVDLAPQVLMSPDVVSAIRQSMDQGGSPTDAIGLTPTLAEMLMQPRPPQQTAEPAPEPDTVFQGAVKSFLSAAVPEVIGMRPSESVEAFRAENPGIGAATEIAGLIPGFVAGIGLSNAALRALPKIGPKFAQTVSGLGKAAAETGVAPAVESAAARGALRTGLEIAPFEAARIATAATTEDAAHARDIAAQAIINIGAGAAIGAGLRAFAESRPAKVLAIRGEEQAAKIISNYNISKPPQEKLANLRVFSRTKAFNDELTDGDKSNIKELIGKFEHQIETEWPGSPKRGVKPAVRKLVTDKTDNKALSGLFARVKGSAESHGKFVTYKIPELINGQVRGIAGETKDEMVRRLKDITMDGWQQFAEHPTLVRPRTAEGAKAVSKNIKGNMGSVDSVRGWWMAREAGVDGRYVMARKLRGGAAPSESDLWFVTKTNSPRQFLPQYEQQLRDLEHISFAMRESPKVMGKEITGTVVDDLTGEMLPGKGIGLAKEAKPLFEAAFSPDSMFLSLDNVKARELRLLGLLPKDLVDDILIGARELGTALKKFTAPTTARSSTIAESRLLQVTRGVGALAHKRVVEQWAGRLPRGALANRQGGLFKQLSQKRQGGLRGLVQSMAKANTDDAPTLAQFTSAIDNDLTIGQATEAGFDRTVLDLLKALRKLRFDKDRELRLATDVYGFTGELVFKDSYYHVAKAFRGNLRLPIHEVRSDGTLGRVIDYASGGSSRQVMAEAEALKTAMAERGFKIAWPTRGTQGAAGRADKPLIAPYSAELDGRLMSKLQKSGEAYRNIKQARADFYRRPTTPGRLRGSSLTDRASFSLRPMTQKEVENRIFSSLLEHERFVGEMMLRGKYLKPELSRMSGMTPEVVPGGGMWKVATEASEGEFPLAAGNINTAITKVFGAEPPGSFSRMVDELTTNTIGIPLTQVTRAVNQGMFHLTLAAGDLGFPALNALSTIQATLPEVAFVARAPTAELAKYYSVSMLKHRGGITGYQALDPMKIGWQAMKDLRNPTAELRKAVNWAIQNDAVSPRFVEEWAGELTSSAGISGLRAVQRGELPLSEWASNLNKFLPVKSEEFARLWSFLIGKRVGQDFMKLEGDELMRFSKLFTEKTMFNYGAADRPAMLTGGIGSMWGLFKNWSTHYMWNMWGYGKQGFNQGDFTPLLWAMGTTGTIGGAAAVPGYFAVDQFAKFVGDKSAMAMVNENLEGTGAGPFVDAFFYGLPSTIGLSLSARAAVPGADPIRDVNTFFSIATLDRAGALLQLPGEFSDLFAATGELPGQSRQVFDHFMRATMPRTVYRYQQAASEAGIRSLKTGNLLTADPNLMQRVAFILGITPLEVQKHFDLAGELWADTERAKQITSLLGEEYAEAMEHKDIGATNNLLKRATAKGVSPNAVVSSGVANYHNRNQELLERQYQDLISRRKIKTIIDRE